MTGSDRPIKQINTQLQSSHSSSHVVSSVAATVTFFALWNAEHARCNQPERILNSVGPMFCLFPLVIVPDCSPLLTHKPSLLIRLSAQLWDQRPRHWFLKTELNCLHNCCPLTIICVSITSNQSGSSQMDSYSASLKQHVLTLTSAVFFPHRMTLIATP